MAIHKNDIGTILSVTVQSGGSAVDVSTASTKQILLKKPDGTLLTKTASFVTDGIDGQIKYTTIANDLDQDGLWFIQSYIVIGTQQFHTASEFFIVEPNL